MGGKMDWRRAAPRTAQRQPQDQPTRPQTPATGAWRDILDAMGPTTPRKAKPMGRKGAPR
jgi:hypothetical protein